MTDPVADMIVRIKNASMAGHSSLSLPYSKLKHAIADKLKDRGFLKEVTKHGKQTGKTLLLELNKTDSGEYMFKELERISKPGCRVYSGVSDIETVRGGTGTVFLSTPRGILAGDEARKANVGGELLFKIW